jgi:hypothetical protein
MAKLYFINIYLRKELYCLIFLFYIFTFSCFKNYYYCNNPLNIYYIILLLYPFYFKFIKEYYRRVKPNTKIQYLIKYSK